MLTHIERKYIYLTMQLEELLHLSTLQRMKIKSSELWGRGGPIHMFFRSVLTMMGGLCPLTSHCKLMMTVMMITKKHHFLKSKRVSWEAELSAGGAKRDVENIPKYTCLNCILAP